jgi:hypothetical protein
LLERAAPDIVIGRCRWMAFRSVQPARLELALRDAQVAREPDHRSRFRHVWLRECVVCFEPRGGDGDLEHRDQLSPTRLGFNSRRHNRLPSVGEHDDITGLEVRRGVLEAAEVVAGCVVETVDGYRALSIDQLARSETPALH